MVYSRKIGDEEMRIKRITTLIAHWTQYVAENLGSRLAGMYFPWRLGHALPLHSFYVLLLPVETNKYTFDWKNSIRDVLQFECQCHSHSKLADKHSLKVIKTEFTATVFSNVVVTSNGQTKVSIGWMHTIWKRMRGIVSICIATTSL